ncbi:hypothetical protein DTO063F5_5953 [Paecilomyces variotii]|nr:hypothetical protein DTO063F5_5953 [Paecilomyces variotii]
MAQSPTPVPQHVSALLTHLTSRPGVQSTLILSRKDGSIIQCTGLLAASSNQTAPGSRGNAVETSAPPSSSSSEPTPSTDATSSTATNQTPPYKPSHAEALAAHIHAFVTSASALSTSLSHPASATGTENGYGSRSLTTNAYDETSANSIGSRDDDAEGENHKEDEDEVKLLRLRTKKHEIVVVPDRKYLLCVVHGASGAAGSAGAPGGGGASR